MKKIPVLLVVAVLTLFGGSVTLLATPSTTYWTPATLDIQPPKLTHVTYDTYVRLGNPGSDPVAEFPVDYGLTWGTKLGKANAEYGVDYLAPSDDPIFFNAKFGFLEGTLAKGAPAVQLGFFNFGTKSNVTNQNIIYLVLGKSLPNGQGRFTIAPYIGNDKVLRSSSDEKENKGIMAAYDRVIIPDKVIFAADYASGKNAIGGGGFGLYYFFNKNTSLLAGPVWFNDSGINGKTKFTLQLDINF